MKVVTIDTADGPFTVLVRAQVVLASGWSADPTEIVARLRLTASSSSLTRVDQADPDVAGVLASVRSYYAGRWASVQEVRVSLAGSTFREQVWAALRRIEPGSTISYVGLARMLGHPKAVRAVAGACAANPAALFVPCHRVISNDGGPGGFAWGTHLKAALLARESSTHR